VTPIVLNDHHVVEGHPPSVRDEGVHATGHGFVGHDRGVHGSFCNLRCFRTGCCAEVEDQFSAFEGQDLHRQHGGRLLPGHASGGVEQRQHLLRLTLGMSAWKGHGVRLVCRDPRHANASKAFDGPACPLKIRPVWGQAKRFGQRPFDHVQPRLDVGSEAFRQSRNRLSGQFFARRRFTPHHRDRLAVGPLFLKASLRRLLQVLARGPHGMDGTPTPSLVLLVAGLAWWAWPRALSSANVDLARRWLPVGGAFWVLTARVVASISPGAWPHFAAHLDGTSTVLERLVAVLVAEGGVVLALTVTTVLLALDQGPAALRRRAEAALPLVVLCVLGLDGTVEHFSSAPAAPTQSLVAANLVPSLLAVLLALAWLGRWGAVTRPASALLGMWCLLEWTAAMVHDPAVLSERGPTLLAAGALLALGPRQAPARTLRGPRGVVRFVSMTWALHLVALALVLPPLLGHDAWSVVSVAMTSTTVLAVVLVAMLASLRVGMDAHEDAVWLVSTRALRFVGFATLIVNLHAGLIALSLLGSGWLAWSGLWLNDMRSKTGRQRPLSDHRAYEQK